MLQLWDYFVLSISALLPLINPLSSALVFFTLAMPFPSITRWRALPSIPFCFSSPSNLPGPHAAFFGISLPIVRLREELVIASIGWSLLKQENSEPSREKMEAAAAVKPEDLAGNLG